MALRRAWRMLVDEPGQALGAKCIGGQGDGVTFGAIASDDGRGRGLLVSVDPDDEIDRCSILGHVGSPGIR